jgi:hypothetical protein
MSMGEFEQYVLAQASGDAFRPMVLYNQDDDSLEVLISDENYRSEKIESFVVYVGRESGDVTGVLIRHVSRLAKDIQNDPPDIRLVIHDGKIKVSRLFKAIRESKKQLVVLINLMKQLEEAVEQYDLEANIGTCAAGSR